MKTLHPSRKDADPFSVRLPWTSYSCLRERSLSTVGM